MKDRNENREGYKLTKLGWIPEDWEISTLATLGQFVKGQGIAKSELTVVGEPAVRYGEIYTHHHFYIKKFYSFIPFYIAKNSSKLIKGDVLFTCSGETKEEIGKCVAFLGDCEAYAGGDIAILRNSKEDSLFLGFQLNSEIVNRQKYRLAEGHSIVHIYPEELSQILVPLAPMTEQITISSCLSTWDRAIQTLSQLIEQKKLRKKWLMQVLLTGKKRLRGFNVNWEVQKLKDYFSERNEIGHDHLPLLSVGEAGVYYQNESNKRDISNEDKSKYKRICKGDIGYNTMRMWQGRSALSGIEGIVSPAYTIVKPKADTDAEFFAFLFKLPSVVHKFYRNSQGLVSDTLNCKFKDFAIVKVELPVTRAEQTAIAKVLQTANNEIEILTRKLNQLKEQKKGLMQQLLTGGKRLN